MPCKHSRPIHTRLPLSPPHYRRLGTRETLIPHIMKLSRALSCAQGQTKRGRSGTDHGTGCPGARAGWPRQADRVGANDGYCSENIKGIYD